VFGIISVTRGKFIPFNVSLKVNLKETNLLQVYSK